MMRTRRLTTAPIAAVAVALLASCTPVAQTHLEPAPAVIEKIDGTDLHRITLTERAAERLGIQTAAAETVAVDGSPTDRLVIPYSAVFYGSDGATWAYANPEPLVFLRASIEVDYVVDDLAVLESGDAGMTVVSVGAAELYGAESGLGAGGH